MRLNVFSPSAVLCGLVATLFSALLCAADPPSPAPIGPPAIGGPKAPAASSVPAQPAAELDSKKPKPAAPPSSPVTPSDGQGGTRRPNFAPVVPPKDYQPPVLVVEQATHDWGTVFKGEVVQHRYEVKNTGGSPLIIQKVKPSCGCTVVDEATIDKVIQPGATGRFELKIETSRLTVGKQQKYADVQTNDPKQSAFRVFIKGQIDALFKVEPEQVRIQGVRGLGQTSTELTITKSVTTDLKLLGTKSQSGRLLVELQELAPATKYKLLLKTNYGPKDTQSYFSEVVQLEVQVGEKKMTQDIPVTVQIKDRVDINPRSVYFKRTDFQPLREKGTVVVKTIDLKAAVEDPAYKYTIKDLKVDDPDKFFKVTQETVKEGREYRIIVTVDKLPEAAVAGTDAKNAPQKSAKGNITFTTDDPQMAEQSIRLIAFY